MDNTTLDSRSPAAGEAVATRRKRLAPGWFLVSPSVVLLLIWMIVPLG
ncbi:MAG: sugar ABC transporter permease, partial [Pseudomonas sp.]